MKKQILISRCEECPYFEVLDSIYGVKENITPYPVCHLKHIVISCNTTTQIDPGCPLEDAGDEKTDCLKCKSFKHCQILKITNYTEITECQEYCPNGD